MTRLVKAKKEISGIDSFPDVPFSVHAADAVGPPVFIAARRTLATGAIATICDIGVGLPGPCPLGLCVPRKTGSPQICCVNEPGRGTHVGLRGPER